MVRFKQSKANLVLLFTHSSGVESRWIHAFSKRKKISSGIWTQLDASISYDDNHNAGKASLSVGK